VAVPLTDASFTSFFKSGRSLEVNEKTSLTDLRKGLITLNKEYEKELTELEQFYTEKRNTLKALISTKEKAEGKKK